MIGKLKGIIDEVNGDYLLLDVGGVGYQLSCPHSFLERAEVGAQLTLWVITHQSDHALTLYGFVDAAQRDWFNLLISVHGVGNKAALGLLSLGLGLGQAIREGNAAALSKAPGIGKKLAERLITELKNKLPANAADGKVVPLHPTRAGGAVSALINLGYPESVARTTVHRVMDGKDSEPLEETIRTCLRELAR